MSRIGFWIAVILAVPCTIPLGLFTVYIIAKFGTLAGLISLFLSSLILALAYYFLVPLRERRRRPSRPGDELRS